MKKIARKMSAVAMTIAMAATMAACGSSSSSSSSSAAASDSAAPAASTAAEASDASTGSSEGVTLNISSNLQNTTFDLMSTHQSYGTKFIFDYLLMTAADGTMEPWLCTSYEIADDGLSMTMHLREDATFTNGDKLTAADVQYCLMRPVNDRTMVSARTYQKLENVEVVDDYTVKLIFNATWPTCVEDLGVTPIYDSKLLEEQGDEYWQMPIGSGAYKLETFDTINSSYTAVKNDDWWGWKELDNPTNVTSFTYKQIDEDTTRVSALRTGEFDIIGLVPFDDVELLESEGKQVIETVENRHIMIGFNYNGIFKDENLRKAVSESIDRDLLVDSVIGIGNPCKWPWCIGVTANPDATGYTYDLEDAKKLVEESGYDGTEISLLTSNAATTRVNELAQALQSMLMDAGFNVKINMVEEATYDIMRSGGEYDLAIGVFNTPASGDAYKETVEIIGGDIFGTGWITNGADKDLEEMCKSIETDMTDARMDTMKEAYQYTIDHCGPYIYLYNTTGIWAASEAVDTSTIEVDSTGDWDIFELQVNK